MLTTRKSLLALTASAALLLSACTNEQSAQNAEQGGIMGGGGLDKSDVGTGLGVLGGALIGSQFGHGQGRVAGTIIGAVAGGAIGRTIGKNMDRDDVNYYQQTRARTLETAAPGQSLPWSNPSNGHSGTIVAQAPYQQASGQYCREYTSTINVGGQAQRAYGTACRPARRPAGRSFRNSSS